MIDVHMLLTPHDSVELLDRSLVSLQNEPINLHFIDGVIGDIGRGRVEGFKRGDNKYVGWVDPDDYITPGAFAECLAYLEAHPVADGVYMHEAVSSNGRIVHITKHAHHMTVVKRAVVEKLFGAIQNCPVPESPINSLKSLHCIPKVGYYYCIRPDSACRNK